MAMAFGDCNTDFAFSGCSTTTDNDQACNWRDWSPVLDWDALPHGRDDFLDVIDFSLMNVDGVAALQQDLADEALQDTTSNSASPASSTDTMTFMEEDSAAGDDFKGLRLVHLLMAAAEALTGANKSCELARVILVRLKELVSPTDGSNMERLAAYFTDALHGLLDGGGSHGGGRHLITNGPQTHHHLDHNQSDILAAFQLLQDMSPYVKFGHFTANQAILEGVANDRRIHIVDYDIMEGIQWASLMQALASRKEGPPSPHLRITALSRGGTGRRSISTVQETGRRLVAFAASIGQPFSFHQCRLDSDEGFKASAVKLVRGEALIVNCMLHLPHSSHRAPESVASFLSGAKTLNPRLVTLVEEEVAAADDGGFASRFMDSLHHFSAVYDSLEAGFPMQGRARALVERVFLGPRIAGSVARIYKTRDEERCSWWEWLGAAGFTPVDVSFANHCQAKLLLGLFNDGFRAEELGRNRLALGWKSRRLISASVWTSSDLDF